MFSSRVPSPLYPSSNDQSHTPAGRSLSIPATLPPLPTGGCQFILLHPSVPDQRCSCQGFRRHEGLPGAHCQCGHQACYHTHEMAPPTDPECTCASCIALTDRIRRLEARYEYERNVWQEELKEERRARREDVRILREAMYSFYKFMEQDIPQKFEYVEDKIEGVVDRQQQLQERLMTVDDSTMALEDRVADLEDERRDGNGREEDDEKKEVDDDVKMEPDNDITTLETSSAAHNSIHSFLHVRSPTLRERRSYSEMLPAPSLQTLTPKSPSKSRLFYEMTHAESRNKIAFPGSRSQMLTSARDITFSMLSRENVMATESELELESLRQDQSDVMQDSNETSIETPKVSSIHLDNQDSSFPEPSTPLQTVKQTQLKRKRHGIDHEGIDSATKSRPFFTLPSPPPLSLSSPEQSPARCHVRETYREHSVASYSSVGLTN